MWLRSSRIAISSSPQPPKQFLIERKKIVGYLLDASHPDGGGKAKFFLSHGFDLSDIATFARCILSHPLAPGSALTKIAQDAYAPKFIYEGPLLCPDGEAPRLRTVWELKNGDTHGRL